MEDEKNAVSQHRGEPQGDAEEDIRQRIYFAADTESGRLEQLSDSRRESASLLNETPESGERLLATSRRSASTLGRPDTERDGGRTDLTRRLTQGRSLDGRDCEAGLGSHAKHVGQDRPGRAASVTHSNEPGERLPDRDSSAGEHLHPIGARLERHFGDVREWRGPGWIDPLTARSAAAAGATGGFWGDCDWWYGRDGKYRPIGTGLFPLAHGAPARVGRLRGYGNGIVAPQAAEFIRAYIAQRIAGASQ